MTRLEFLPSAPAALSPIAPARPVGRRIDWIIDIVNGVGS